MLHRILDLCPGSIVELGGGPTVFVVIRGGSFCFQVSITGRFCKREHAKTGSVYSICIAHDNLHNLEIGEKSDMGTHAQYAAP